MYVYNCCNVIVYVYDKIDNLFGLECLFETWWC